MAVPIHVYHLNKIHNMADTFIIQAGIVWATDCRVRRGKVVKSKFGIILAVAAYFLFNNSTGNSVSVKSVNTVTLSQIISNPDLYNNKIVYTKWYPIEYFSILGGPYLLIKYSLNNKVLLKAINYYHISDSLITFKVQVNSLVKLNDFGLLYLEEVKWN